MKKFFIVLLAFIFICVLIIFTLRDQFNINTILFKIEEQTGFKFNLHDENTWVFFPSIEYNNENVTISHIKNSLQIKSANININKSYWPTSPFYINLNSPVANYAGTEMRKLEIDATYANNILNVEKISSRIVEGNLQLRGQFDLDNYKQFYVEGEFNNISINTLLKQSQVASWKRVNIKLSSSNFTLSGKGENKNFLLASLAGTIPITGSFYLTSSEEERFGAALLSLLVEKIPRLSSISKSINFLLSNYADIPSTLNGTLTLKDGLIQSDEIFIVNKGAKSTVKGSYDILNDSIDGTIYFYDQNKIFLEASLKGKIENPQILVGGKVFKDNEGKSVQDLKQLFEGGINSFLDKLLKINE